MGLFDFWKLFFKDGYCVAQSNGNDGAVGFGGKFEAALMKFQQIQIAFVSVSCSFWEDADGNSRFDLLNTS